MALYKFFNMQITTDVDISNDIADMTSTLKDFKSSISFITKANFDSYRDLNIYYNNGKLVGIYVIGAKQVATRVQFNEKETKLFIARMRFLIKKTLENKLTYRVPKDIFDAWQRYTRDIDHYGITPDIAKKYNIDYYDEFACQELSKKILQN